MEFEENSKIEKNNELKNEISNEIANGEKIEEKQNIFLESTIGKVINTGIDMGLRAILPNVIEDEVIGIKNVMFTDGIQKGIKTAIDSAINLGKSAMGIVTGKFDSVSQAYTAIKSGGILDSTSKIIDNAVKAAKQNGLINNPTANLIKRGKNAIKNTISDSIEENFMEQVDGVEKLGKYVNNWNNYLAEKDLERNEQRVWKNKEKIRNANAS